MADDDDDDEYIEPHIDDDVSFSQEGYEDAGDLRGEGEVPFLKEEGRRYCERPNDDEQVLLDQPDNIINNGGDSQEVKEVGEVGGDEQVEGGLGDSGIYVRENESPQQQDVDEQEDVGGEDVGGEDVGEEEEEEEDDDDDDDEDDDEEEEEGKLVITDDFAYEQEALKHTPLDGSITKSLIIRVKNESGGTATNTPNSTTNSNSNNNNNSTSLYISPSKFAALNFFKREGASSSALALGLPVSVLPSDAPFVHSSVGKLIRCPQCAERFSHSFMLAIHTSRKHPKVVKGPKVAKYDTIALPASTPSTVATASSMSPSPSSSSSPATTSVITNTPPILTATPTSITTTIASTPRRRGPGRPKTKKSPLDTPTTPTPTSIIPFAVASSFLQPQQSQQFSAAPVIGLNSLFTPTTIPGMGIGSQPPPSIPTFNNEPVTDGRGVRRKPEYGDRDYYAPPKRPRDGSSHKPTSATEVLAHKIENLTMLKHAVAQGLITEEQYKHKQEEFLKSISFH